MKNKKSTKILIKNIAYPFIGVFVFLAVWWIAAAMLDYKLILPSPPEVLKSSFFLFKSGDFWVSVMFTLIRTFISLAVSLVFAVFLSLISAVSPLKKMISPLITVVRALPTMVAVLWFLIWTSATITPVLVAILIVFPTLFSSFTVSLDEVPAELIDTAKSCGANTLQLTWLLYLPSLRRSLIENTASGFSLTFKIVISAEIMAYTVKSAGLFMLGLKADIQIPRLLASAIIVCIVCIAAEFFIRLPLKNKKAQ